MRLFWGIKLILEVENIEPISNIYFWRFFFKNIKLFWMLRLRILNLNGKLLYSNLYLRWANSISTCKIAILFLPSWDSSFRFTIDLVDESIFHYSSIHFEVKTFRFEGSTFSLTFLLLVSLKNSELQQKRKESWRAKQEIY